MNRIERSPSLIPITVWRYWIEEKDGTIHQVSDWSTDQQGIRHQLEGALSTNPDLKGYTEWGIKYLLPHDKRP
jgi:hypothetical protein